MTEKDDIYEGGFARLVTARAEQMRPFDDVDTVLPPADVDLEGLYSDTVPAPLKAPDDCPEHSAERAWMRLQAEFEGDSGLFLVHGMLTTILTRMSPPDAADTLFLRCWTETGTELAEGLPVPWLVSAARVFARHGASPDQRALGMGLSVLFDLVKLHESERRLSGQPGYKPFRRAKDTKLYKMPFGLAPYALKKGQLDKAMLSTLWELSQTEPVMRPLGTRLLAVVMTDRRSIFSRLERLKHRKS